MSDLGINFLITGFTYNKNVQDILPHLPWITCNEEIDPQIRQQIKTSHYIRMTAFPYQYRQLDHRRGHINSRLNIRWWAWQWNTTKEINKHAIQAHYWRERIDTFNNEGSNYDQNHHAGISMNDKHEQGKGIEIVRTKVSVTWTKFAQHRGVICQSHPVPESDVLPFLTTNGGHT